MERLVEPDGHVAVDVFRALRLAIGLEVHFAHIFVELGQRELDARLERVNENGREILLGVF